MPCPCFEPKTITSTANGSGGRRPLIDEYEGLCHAQPEPVPVPEEARFRWCNHGNSKGACGFFPVHEIRSCLRYELTRFEDRTMRVLCIEEQSHSPLRWYAFEYFADEQRLEPEPQDTCVRSQVLAFCRSYLAHFVAPQDSAR
ncbi:MAG: hypothetical protein JO211_13995 [Acidobacteriaceae bacterium]|nr:hypothetical protein [Acidobacteriaceae bacterium]